ncbi:MAG: hypothetical protein LBQ90_04650 [Synergistaceae bacterium]|jgi:hypothetical protein|nr:hypothetical protein [Synergistaceae bacterium]
MMSTMAEKMIAQNSLNHKAIRGRHIGGNLLIFYFCMASASVQSGV